MTGDLVFAGVGIAWGLAIAFTLWWITKDAQRAELGEGVE